MYVFFGLPKTRSLNGLGTKLGNIDRFYCCLYKLPPIMQSLVSCFHFNSSLIAVIIYCHCYWCKFWCHCCLSPVIVIGIFSTALVIYLQICLLLLLLHYISTVIVTVLHVL